MKITFHSCSADGRTVLSNSIDLITKFRENETFFSQKQQVKYKHCCLASKRGQFKVIIRSSVYVKFQCRLTSAAEQRVGSLRSTT